MKNDGISKPADREFYQSLVGSLLYATMANRPDIAQAVSAEASYTAAPSEAHVTAARRMLKVPQGKQQYQPHLPLRRRGFTCILQCGLGWRSKWQEIYYRQCHDSRWSSHLMAEQETVICRSLDCWCCPQPVCTGDCLGPTTATPDWGQHRVPHKSLGTTRVLGILVVTRGPGMLIFTSILQGKQ